ncbi:FAD-binding oxidoreductase [Gemmobacter sp.]|uniref:FAD-binding oxidoreductase n=1 Tax=Gemmobacter sp. TaxID=1898957 RepID=UPI002AFFEF84|nr:FAD-binding oxidoreductase [Gemmobacter sp.]
MSQPAPTLPPALLAHQLADAPRYRDDAAGKPGAAPLAVLAPRSAQDAAAILRALQSAGLAAVVQGGRTGLSGGARVQPGEVVLSTERLTAPPVVDPVAATMTLGAGVPLETAQQAARDHGLYLAADLGARGSATVGGMAATNAGGPLALRYGTFRQQVLGLEAVLPDGTIVSRLGGLAKDNSGLDLSQYLIGSEGVLGLITRLVLRLHPAPTARRVAVCALEGAAQALALLPVLRAGLGPLLQACELIIDPLLSETCARRGLRYPFATPAAAVLLVEVAGPDPAADAARLETVLGAALETGQIADAVLSASEADCLRLWALRDGCSHYLIENAGPLTSLDLSLPLPAIPAFLDQAAALCAGRARPYVFGHLGDGNLHYILACPPDDALTTQVFALTARHGGVITAEHGIGLDKVRWLPLCRDAAEIAAMARIKGAIDPGFILNPGRIFGTPA